MEITEYPVIHWDSWGGNRRKDLKRALIKKYKVCYWCNVEVVDWVHKDGEPKPPNAGTIDHLIPRAYRGYGKVVPKVLACEKCNTERSNAQNPNNPAFKNEPAPF